MASVSYQPTPGAPTIPSVMENKGNAPFYLDPLLAAGAAHATSAAQGQAFSPGAIDLRNHFRDVRHPDTVRTQSYEDAVKGAEYSGLAVSQAATALAKGPTGR